MTNGADPRVSVIMAAYNTERWIGAAIDSILGQTFSDFELLVVDDGSTDGTPEVINERARKDRRIRIMQPGRVGVVEARNMAIREARGEYVAIMDCDDLSMPERFATQVAFLDTNPDVLAVTSGVAIIHSQLAVPNDISGLKTLTPPDGPVGCLDGFNLSYKTVFHPPAMLRRTALIEIGLYRPLFTQSQDADLFLRLEEVGPVRRLPDVLCLYRRHLENTSFRFPYAQIELGVLALILARRRRRGKPDLASAPARPFWRLFQLGLTPAEIAHALILAGLRCARKVLKRRKRYRRLAPILAPAPSARSL
jgi:glycosyltransferase involved in cell wall biosynthesis